MPLLVAAVPMRFDPLHDFCFDGLFQQSLSAVSQNVRQHVLGAYGWQRNDRIATLSHGGVLRGECGCEVTKFKPKYAAFFNSTHPQLSGIAHCPRGLLTPEIAASVGSYEHGDSRLPPCVPLPS